MSRMKLIAMCCLGLAAAAKLPHLQVPLFLQLSASAIGILALTADALLIIYDTSDRRRTVLQSIFYLIVASAVMPLGSIILALRSGYYLASLSSLVGLAAVISLAIWLRHRISVLPQ